MIRLSTKGRYGTRLMLNLASHYKIDGDAIILKNVSNEEGLSIRYLEQIVIPLKINKLIKSIRGAGGGYTLARDPSRINLREILHALEGTCCLVECVEEEDICDRQPYCAAHDIWKGATLLLKNYFENITLADLVKASDRKNKKTRSH